MAEFPTIATVPSPYPASGQNGAIGGGVLRPGAIDQGQFQQLLRAKDQAQNRTNNQGNRPATGTGMTLSDYRKLAGIQVASGAAVPVPAGRPAAAGMPPGPAPGSAPSDGIPTLTLEQFAALTGISAPEAPPGPVEPAPDSADSPPLFAVPGDQTAEAAALDTAFEGQAVDAAELADGVPTTMPVDETASPAPAEDRQAEDPRVVLFDTAPDRDERRTLAGQGKTWRLRETPGARELFLGPDGTFGWDDFIDIINPLQHIPVVAQIYRAVTGDQAYGLSAFIGAVPFGPLSVASAVVDTMIRSQTGRDAGTDMAARVLGIDNRAPEEANLSLVNDGAGQVAMATPADNAAMEAAAIPAAAIPASEIARTGTMRTRDMNSGRG